MNTMVRLTALLIEDDEDDYVLARDLLSESLLLEVELDWAKTYEDGLQVMQSSQHDVCLLDYRLGAHTGLELLNAAPPEGWKAAVIFLTGQGEGLVDLEAMRAGAVDYLDKKALSPIILERSIRYAVERRQAASRRTELAVERERVRLMEQFVADASHDLRTPVTVILSSVELLRRYSAMLHESIVEAEAKLAEGQRHVFAKVRDVMSKMQRHINVQVENSLRLKGLLEDLLDLVRLDSGIVFDLRHGDLDALATRQVEAQKTLAETKRQSLNYIASVTPLIAIFDEGAINRVIQNLIGNAIRYTPEGGHITVQIYPQDERAVFEVRDTGIGISEEDLPHIFERFYRTDKARSSDKGGTGLGLAIVQKIVESHNGRIEVESTLGQGSVFRVLLPLGDAPALGG